MKWKDSFHPYAMVTILFWSLAYVLTRLALRSFSAFSLGFLRYAAASCTLVIVAVATKMSFPDRSDLKWFLASGGTGFFLYMIFFNKGCETVTASTSSVLIATVPVMTALLARLVYKEKLYFFQWTAIGVEFAGVVILTVLGCSFSFNMGLIWLLLAALALSIYNLLQRKLTRTYTALQTSAFSIFAGTVMLGLFSPAALRETRVAPPIYLFYVILLGVFCSAVAYVSWSKAFTKAELTSSVSNYMFVTPFMTSLLGFLMIGEIPDFATVIGGAVIMSGILVFNFGDSLFIHVCRTKE